MNHMHVAGAAAAGFSDAPPPYHQVPYQGYPTQQVVYAYPGQQIYGSNPPPYGMLNCFFNCFIIQIQKCMYTMKEVRLALIL